MTEQRKPKVDPFPTAMTQAVADVLAQTDYPGLSTGRLEALLPAAKLTELDPGPNKRTRLATTLNNVQVVKGDGAYLAAFVNAAMDPVRFADDPNHWHALRGELNARLVFFGFRINDQGKLARGAQASTLDEAAELAGVLHAELRRRGCHDALFAYCREELLRQSLFHAMSEAAKSFPDRLRRHSGSGKDGADLYGELFGTAVGAPRVPINAFSSDSERSEHKGFVTMLNGIHAHYRNPRAHSTRLGSSEDRQDFLDAFALFSYVHRRLDAAGVRA